MKTILLSLAILLGVTIPASAGDFKFRYQFGRYQPARPYYPRRPDYYRWHHRPGGPGVTPYTYKYGRTPFGGRQRWGVMPPIYRDRSPYFYYGWEFEF